MDDGVLTCFTHPTSPCLITGPVEADPSEAGAAKIDGGVKYSAFRSDGFL